MRVTLDKDMGLLEVCSSPICRQVSFPHETEEVYIGPEVAMHDHEMTAKVWAHGQLVKQMGTTCKAHPFCESIQCYLCGERLLNPQCSPKAAIVLVFILCVIAVLCLGATCQVLDYLIRIVRCCVRSGWSCLSCCCGVFPWCRDLFRRLPVPVRRQRRPQARAARFNYLLPTIIFTVVCVGGVQSCSEVTTLQADRQECTYGEHGRLTCTLNQISRLSLVPQGQETCLLISDPNGDPLGTLTLSVDHIRASCRATTSYYTRSFDFKVESRKRCSHAGSCSNNKCGDVKSTTKLSEMSSDANSSPGFTRCLESCGCAACGCLLCTAGCLFYRVYAVPTSSTPYEVFSCSSWDLKVKVKVQLHLQSDQSDKHHVFDLTAGVPVQWQSVKLVLISMALPPMPFTDKKFVTDGHRALMVETSAAGQSVTGTLGQLQCKTLEKAKNFKCEVPIDSCLCNGQEETVNCECNHQKIEHLFATSKQVLPFSTSGFTLFSSGRTVEAQYNALAALELQVELLGLTLTTKTDRNRCQIEVSAFSGCYRCLTGAKLAYKCTTDFGRALAHVKCGTEQFSTTVYSPRTHGKGYTDV